MITKMFYFDLFRKKFCQKILRSTNFKQKLRHQVVKAEAVEEEALRVEAEAETIQKFSLPHSQFQHEQASGP